jgi:hypothetical protein
MNVINKWNLLFSVKTENLYIRYDLLVNSFTKFLSFFWSFSITSKPSTDPSEHLTNFIPISRRYIRYSKNMLFRTSSQHIPISLLSITIFSTKVFTDYRHKSLGIKVISEHPVTCPGVRNT